MLFVSEEINGDSFSIVKMKISEEISSDSFRIVKVKISEEVNSDSLLSVIIQSNLVHRHNFP